MSSQADKGQEAFKAGKYEDAITYLTSALKTSQAPLWLISRATAYQRLGKYELALADGDNAFLAAKARARREQMATAQFRRAVALHGLKRYGDARLCLSWTRKLNEKEKGLGIWQAKVAADYELAEKDGREEQTACMVKEVPDKIEEVSAEKDVKENIKPTIPSLARAAAPSVAAPLQPTPKEKIKHDWYQSTDKVTISIMAKGVPKDKAEIIIEEGSVSDFPFILENDANNWQLEVSFPTSGTESYDYTITPLFAKINPSTSSYRVTPHKIEIILQKSTPNQKWPSLEGNEPIAPTQTPSYPTSSRTGPKDWEKLGEDGVEPEPEDVDSFFKTLYKGADPDTQKAMMKSYQESNGTALSTNWSEVSKGTVQTKPPEGIVAKKWNE
jgi:suppressor of G2 allele of SKP1